MRYLAQLLTHPGRELHLLDLIAAETRQQMDLGDAGQILHARAKAPDRRRLAEIDAERARSYIPDHGDRTAWSP
jgi:hypothetical protein